MSDVREEILQRIEDLLAELQAEGDFRHAFRNKYHFSEGDRPCIVLYDGDEQTSPDDNNKRWDSPRRTFMQPKIAILATEVREEIGTTLNGLRAKVIYKLHSDTTLRALVLDDRINYVGCDVLMENGRAIEGSLVLIWDLAYLLKVSDLAPDLSSE